MKSKKSLKALILTIISLITIMSFVGCLENDKTSQDQESSTSTSTDSTETNSSAENSKDNPILSGSVLKIDSNKITIAKTTQDSKGNTTSPKKGSPQATKNSATFEISKDTTVIIKKACDEKNLKFSDTPGTTTDIKVDSAIAIWGDKNGDLVKATKVVIFTK